MCKLTYSKKDGEALRNALGCFPTGVAVVTTAPEVSAPAGITINSFHSISLSPALVGWCIDRRAASFRTFSRCGQFTLSFLEEAQGDIARRFATRGADKFEGMTSGDPAGPVIPGACAWLRCRLYRQVPLGDHLLLVGEVTSFESTAGRPMVFAGGLFGRVSHTVPGGPGNESRKTVASAA